MRGDDRFDACDESLADCVEVRASPAESGVDELGVAFREQQLVQHYASEGIFEHDVRIATDQVAGWVARAPAGQPPRATSAATEAGRHGSRAVMAW